MRFTVVWHAKAQDDLAKIWLSANERNSVSRAANEIDIALRTNPNSLGIEHLLKG